jgi:DNA-binding SARP family transcriptional activator
VEFRVLGPVEVREDGRPLDIGSRRSRYVLGLLLLNTGRLTSAETLIDGLWPQNPPRSARAQLHNMIGHLRRTLGDDRLVTRPGGYELRLDGATFDVHEFRRLTDVAANASAAGEHLASVAAATEALALWNGQALADLGADLIGEQRAALAEEKLATTEILLGAELALDRHDDVLRTVPDLLVDEPYRERLHEFHIRALRGAGRQAEAAAAYERARTRFVEDLGIEPGPDLRAVADGIARPARRAPRQLPPVTPVLTGRADMLSELTAALRDGGTAVLVGPGGAGKTTVAVAAAHELRLSYPDGQLYAELRGSTPNPVDPQSVLARFVRSLAADGDAVPADPAQRAAAFRELLADRRVLIVLDDAGSAAQVRPLLAPGCGVLVTSRQRLGELPDVTRLSVPMLSQDDSVALLTRLVGADRVRAEPTAAREIAALCGHSPLGVCIAGARLGANRELPLTEFRDRLAERTQRLDELAVGDLDVRTTIALSYETLKPDARRLFRRLGLVTAPDWPEWVADGRDGTVAPLVDGHLVESLGVDGIGQRRYRLHDLVADFARERLAEEETAADRDAALTELLETWHALAADADGRIDHGSSYAVGLTMPEPPFEVADPQGWFEAERASLVAAVTEACRLGNSTLAAGLALHSAGYLGVRAYDEERSQMLAAAAACVPPVPDELLVRVLVALFATYHQQSRYLDLAVVAREELTVARRLGDPEWELRALYGSGVVARTSGKLAEAARLYEEAVALARQVAGGTALTNNLIGLAEVYSEAGTPARGLPLYEEVLELERDDQHSRQRAVLLHSYGMALVDAGEHATAIDVLTAGVAVAAAIDDDFGVATISQKLADAEVRAGRPADARVRLATCLRMHERLRNNEGVAWTLRSQSDVAVAEGRWPDAVAGLERALEIQLQIGEPLEIARTLDRLARALDEVGDAARAASHRTECAAILADRGLGAECLDHPPRMP